MGGKVASAVGRIAVRQGVAATGWVPTGQGVTTAPQGAAAAGHRGSLSDLVLLFGIKLKIYV